ncbi:MAG: hypothetical protein K8R53_03350 [Bacteroidales bacterium]|nr:hypothetical protein [Bacteroidales bacterium]
MTNLQNIKPFHPMSVHAALNLAGNHLGVLSAIALTQAGNVYVYDFSTGSDKAYGGILGYKEIGTGVWGMISGDGDASGQVNNQDSAGYQGFW